MRFAKQCITILLTTCWVLFAFGCSSEAPKKGGDASTKEKTEQFVAFNGGPTGGTFNFFANKMSSIISKDVEWLNLRVRASSGSAENLRDLHNSKSDMGIVYAGDGFLGRNGKLPEDSMVYDKVYSMAFLYGAPAQLVVHSDSSILSLNDLKGKIVAIGNSGSGAALSAERFFKGVGLWGSMTVRKVGYAAAADAFLAGEIDAFWVLVGYPNSSVVQAASQGGVRLLNLHDWALREGIYETYPFYTRVVIPAGTYAGQNEDVVTFQDASMWCVRAGASADAVYESLKTIYSEKGLSAMSSAHKAARDMAVRVGVLGLSIPLHPGAHRYWNEQGVDIPSQLLFY